MITSRVMTGTSSAATATTIATSAIRNPIAPEQPALVRAAAVAAPLLAARARHREGVKREPHEGHQAEQGAEQLVEIGVGGEQIPDQKTDHGGQQRHPAAGRAAGSGGPGQHPDRDADAQLEAGSFKKTHVENLHSMDGRTPPPAAGAHADAGSRALRRAVREPDASPTLRPSRRQPSPPT